MSCPVSGWGDHRGTVDEAEVFSLTFLSTAVTPTTDAELRELVQVARRLNSVSDVTSTLTCAGKHFLQTLEGPRPSVDRTFARISADPRHRNVLTVLAEDVRRRAFPTSPMALAVLVADEHGDLASAGLLGALDAEPPGRGGTSQAAVLHRVLRERCR